VRIAFLGFGLIAGSVARRLAMARRSEAAAIDGLAAWSPTGAGPAAAARDGIVDVAGSSPEATIAGADLIVLAGPATACLGMLDDLAGPWRDALAPDAVITDVASTKAAIVLRATALGLRFVGGHPMAGREQAGYDAATPDLFVDRPWIIVPSGDAAAEARVEALAVACGALPMRMSAATHDAAVAAVSHLPLLAAAGLVEAVAGAGSGAGGSEPASPRDDWATAGALAAGGWRDMTRLARGDVDMGTAILATNAEPLAARLRDLIAVLDAWAAELERPGGPDPDAIHQRLAAARQVLEDAGS
jgi:prephenate dehydrogenase